MTGKNTAVAARSANAPAPPSVPPIGLAEMAVNPSIGAAGSVEAYVKRLGELELPSLITAISSVSLEVLGGELGHLEMMLVSQAVTLEAVFHAMLRKAALQNNPARSDALMALALKAQGNSRATISALVDLKHPRQTSFVRQTNVSHGPQQVNNSKAGQPTLPPAQAERAIAVPAPVQAIGMAPVVVDRIIKPLMARSRARESSR